MSLVLSSGGGRERYTTNVLVLQTPVKQAVLRGTELTVLKAHTWRKHILSDMYAVSSSLLHHMI